MELVKYKPSPGGLGDADWFNSPESQWWTVRRDDGVVGLVPMTSLELLGEIPCAGGPSALAFDQHDDAWVTT